MYRSILVVTEGTPLSKKAVKAALRMARDFGAKVTALNVQPPYQPPIAGEVPAAFLNNPAEYDQIAREASAKILADVSAMAAKLEVPTTTVTAFDHSIYKAIIRTAKTRRCDLIVMASHGRRGIRGILLGSETQKVLTHCQIPVLVHR
ncbi:MAG: universal stress protein [Burkholderiaceae bacterium]|nr:universal stress protein [Burkholderiaceae bacterium]